MRDFLIDDMAGHLAASKSREFRDRVRQRFAVFVSFLEENNLTTRALLGPSGLLSDSLKIMRSDLTDEGFAVLDMAYESWLRGHDRGRPIEDTAVLQKALKKIR